MLARCPGCLSKRTGIILLSASGGICFVKGCQRAGVFIPVKMLPGETDCAGCQPLAEFFVATQLQDCVHDAKRVDFIEDPCVDSVFDEAAKVCPRQNDWTSHRKELRNF